MKKIFCIIALCAIGFVMTGCGRSCETEPIVEQNHKLIVPPHFGQMPK